MDFGQALSALKKGQKVSRSGWNGKGTWVILINPGNAAHASGAGVFPMQQCFGMKTASGDMQPGWMASQVDLLAEDWEVLD